ncbi:replicative DNA helicase [Escherichia coli]|uniref:Replicative DNA helicase n=1 Tax=Escherichia coli TaxID=562 RepID=A0A2X1KFB5_ECOLX|nr:replicative DNA helicase [Escherichia coli]
MLGGLMLDNERWDDVAERVVADDFYTRPHRHIFTEMARLQESGSPIDLITLAESLERQGNSIASVVLLIWQSCQKIRQVRRTSVLMLTSCVNVPLSVR